MAICLHHPEKAQSPCPSREVAREFSHKPEGGYRRRLQRRDRRQVKYY